MLNAHWLEEIGIISKLLASPDIPTTGSILRRMPQRVERLTRHRAECDTGSFGRVDAKIQSAKPSRGAPLLVNAHCVTRHLTSTPTGARPLTFAKRRAHARVPVGRAVRHHQP